MNLKKLSAMTRAAYDAQFGPDDQVNPLFKDGYAAGFLAGWRAFGRAGGSAKTKSKSAASRLNGKKGGRPRLRK